MEHQISLSIRMSEAPMQPCTVLQGDSQIERDDGDTTDYSSPANRLSSTSLPKPPIHARTSKPVSPDSCLLNQRASASSLCSPILRPIVQPGPPFFARPQSIILDHNSSSQPITHHSELDTFRLTTSPRWTPTPHTKVLFWWGFLFPPLWLYGSLYLFPPLRRRLVDRGRLPSSNRNHRRPRPAHKLSHLSRLWGPLSKGDVEVGTTTVVIIPRSKTFYDTSYDAPFESDFGATCVSSAERLDAAGIDASEWVHPDSTPGETAAELDKCERRGAYYCLWAFLLLSIITAISVVISQKIRWPSHSSSHLSSPLENEPNMSNNNILGGSSHSSPLR